MELDFKSTPLPCNIRDSSETNNYQRNIVVSILKVQRVITAKLMVSIFSINMAMIAYNGIHALSFLLSGFFARYIVQHIIRLCTITRSNQIN